MLEKLAKQTAIYGISTILGRFLSYMLTPIYTRIFGPETYGIITDVYAIIPFALVVLLMGTESSYFRFAAKAAAGEDTAAAKRRLFSTTWAITSLAALLFFAAVALLRVPASAFMGEYYAAHPVCVVVVAGIVMFDVVSAIPFARLREEGRAKDYVVLKLLNIVMQLAMVGVFHLAGLFRGGLGVGWVFVINLAASALTALLAARAAIDGRLPLPDRRLLGAVLLYSLPLLVSGVAGTANEFIDRQLIKHLTPQGAMAQLGIYGAITKIAVVQVLFTQMYRLAAEPYFLADFKRQGDFLAQNAAALKYFIMVSLAVFLGIALFRDLFALIVGRDFRQGMYILPVVLGANILSGVWLNLSFWYKREERTVYAIWITFAGLLFSVGCGVVLIPRFGNYGAAWSRFLSEAVMVAVSLALNRKYCPTPYQFGRIAEYTAVALLLFFAGEAALTAGLHDAVRYGLNVLLFGLYLLWVVRREHIDIMAMARAIVCRQGADNNKAIQ